jgi:hypothetical protein
MVHGRNGSQGQLGVRHAAHFNAVGDVPGQP